MASPLTVLSMAKGTYIYSADDAYANAVAGTGGTLGVYAAATTTNYGVGQRYQAGSPHYYVYLPLLSFDTSAIPDDATVTSVVMSLYMQNDLATTDFIIEARGPYDWGAAVETSDWVLPSNYVNYALLASMDTTGKSSAQYYALTSEAGFPAAINKTGETTMMLVSSRVRAGTTPTGEERWLCDSEYVANHQPKLVITYTEAGGGGTVPLNLLRTRFFPPRGVIVHG